MDKKKRTTNCRRLARQPFRKREIKTAGRGKKHSEEEKIELKGVCKIAIEGLGVKKKKKKKKKKQHPKHKQQTKTKKKKKKPNKTKTK